MYNIHKTFDRVTNALQILAYLYQVMFWRVYIVFRKI